MTALLSPAEALDLIGDGIDDTAVGASGGVPYLAIDLDRPTDPGVLDRLTRVLAQTPVVIIGVSRTPSGAAASLERFDVLLCEQTDASAPWVPCREGTGPALDRLVAAIARSPRAAVVLVQLLRVGSTMSEADAVVVESFAYSLLQGGPDHRRWLDSRRGRGPRAHPETAAVATSRAGSTLRVLLDRPDVRNAYGTRMRDELVEALALARTDATITVVEVRGAGPAFCSGGDLDEFGTTPDPITAHFIRTTRNAGIAISRVADRVVVHVHGTCVGAGVELPAFAARVVAHPHTTFRLPEVSMGLVPGAGGTSSIPRRIGRHRTAWLALDGEPIDATTALSWGLVDLVDADMSAGTVPR